MADHLIEHFDLEKNIKKMSDRELLEFNTRQLFDIKGTCKDHEDRLKSMEGKASLSGGLTGGITAIIALAVDYLLRLFGLIK